LSKIAVSLAQSIAPKDWDFFFAEERKDDVDHPFVIDILAANEYEIPKEKFIRFSDIPTDRFDVVITLDEFSRELCPVLPELPIRFHWQLKNPLEARKSQIKAKYNDAVEKIRNGIFSIVKHGTLDAIANARITFGSLISNLTEGVLAHDLTRNIFVFNHAAELITGYKAEDVLGRDCHEVFPRLFCGGDCSFCAEDIKSHKKLRYPHKLVRPDGVSRDLEMSVVTLNTDNNKVLGALAIFRDITEITYLRKKANRYQGFHGIIGQHPSIQKVYDAIEELATVNVPILIQGESGTGKELVAEALNLLSPRAKKPFVPINCGALPEGTLESELFGHVRGAFTGAIRDKKGRFELADSGTIFLDEIGEISLPLQVKLLRVLQEKSFIPVGGEKLVKVDVRIICATNRDLKQMTRDGKFREDLYYRLAVVPVTLPPLRERKGDIPLLVEHFFDRFADDITNKPAGISPEALVILTDYPWPGNVRELGNAIQYGIIKSHGRIIQVEHLPLEITNYFEIEDQGKKRPGRPVSLTKELVIEALTRTGGNKARAARYLGVSRTTIYRALEEINVSNNTLV